MNFTILTFDTLQSSNDLLKEHFSSFPHGTVVRTHFQTQGRGQFDRHWEASYGENLLVSILLKDLPIDKLPLIKSWTFASILSLLKEYDIEGVKVEPNDIFVSNKKICGILIESQTFNKHLNYVIVGIGLNVNQTTFQVPEAVSMKLVRKQTFTIDSLFEQWLEILAKTQKKVLFSE
ncbi:MAG: biotin--[acetyl-CoA-carboxylase] ligase [Acholeplasmataceae bacterium]|nr:biotin--[acetyl-CoA-carboxylase] ligase [Acholeplasmataceae bacterium]